HIKYGDSIYLTDSVNIYIYKTDSIKIVSPNRGEVIRDDDNNKLLTLVTCSDVKGTNRLIIQAKFIKKEKLSQGNIGIFKL
ncbi:sortase, partial [Staphylococcus epidermidis]